VNGAYETGQSGRHPSDRMISVVLIYPDFGKAGRMVSLARTLSQCLKAVG
jgi:hypothetical protein